MRTDTDFEQPRNQGTKLFSANSTNRREFWNVKTRGCRRKGAGLKNALNRCGRGAAIEKDDDGTIQAGCETALLASRSATAELAFRWRWQRRTQPLPGTFWASSFDKIQHKRQAKPYSGRFAICGIFAAECLLGHLAAHFLCHSQSMLICRKRVSNCREEIVLPSARCGMRIHAGSWCYSSIFLLARRVRQWSSPSRPSPPMLSLPSFRIVRIRPDTSVVSAPMFIRHQFRRFRPRVRPRKSVNLEKNDAIGKSLNGYDVAGGLIGQSKRTQDSISRIVNGT